MTPPRAAHYDASGCASTRGHDGALAWLVAELVSEGTFSSCTPSCFRIFGDAAAPPPASAQPFNCHLARGYRLSLADLENMTSASRQLAQPCCALQLARLQHRTGAFRAHESSDACLGDSLVEFRPFHLSFIRLNWRRLYGRIQPPLVPHGITDILINGLCSFFFVGLERRHRYQVVTTIRHIWELEGDFVQTWEALGPASSDTTSPTSC